MFPSCTSCVPSCSLFPRSAGGKVMLPPLTSPQDCPMTDNHPCEGWRREVPVEHPPSSCHRGDCICPGSSSGRSLLRHEPAGNYFNGHNRVLQQRHSMNTPNDAANIESMTFPRQPPIPPPTPVPSPHDQKTIRPPTTATAVSPLQTDITTSRQAAEKAELTSSVRTFRFKNSSTHGQNSNRRDTKSPSRRSSPSDADGSLKEINVTRRARRQIYLKPDVEGSPFRLLMYVDCRSVEPQQEVES